MLCVTGCEGPSSSPRWLSQGAPAPQWGGTTGLSAAKIWSPSWVAQVDVFKVAGEVTFTWNCFRIILIVVLIFYQFSNFITLSARKIPDCSVHFLASYPQMCKETTFYGYLVQTSYSSILSAPSPPCWFFCFKLFTCFFPLINKYLTLLT